MPKMAPNLAITAEEVYIEKETDVLVPLARKVGLLMSSNSSARYYFTVWFKSIDQPMTFSVAEAAWGRLKKALQEKRQGFFIWATTDGRTLALNLAFINMARFTCKTASVAEVQMNRHSEITIYFPGHERSTFEADDPVDLANIFSTLKPALDRESLSFIDSKGDLVVLSTEDLILIDTSTIFVEEGYLKIFNQRRNMR